MLEVGWTVKIFEMQKIVEEGWTVILKYPKTMKNLESGLKYLKRKKI